MTGLASPVFVTNAGDGSNRLFVVEQRGTIRVYRGGLKTTPYLDIRSLVEAGGERGLLGLAFHPQLRLERQVLRRLHRAEHR